MPASLIVKFFIEVLWFDEWCMTQVKQSDVSVGVKCRNSFGLHTYQISTTEIGVFWMETSDLKMLLRSWLVTIIQKLWGLSNDIQ